jgi:hypothetical protein
MFGAFVDGWHSVSDDPVFSYNEKYRTDWIGSLYDENLDQPLGRAHHVYGISKI